jgi:hypothetical protein
MVIVVPLPLTMLLQTRGANTQNCVRLSEVAYELSRA